MAPQPMAPQPPKEQKIKRKSYYAVGIATREPVRASLPYKSLPASHTNHCQPPIQITASLPYSYKSSQVVAPRDTATGQSQPGLESCEFLSHFPYLSRIQPSL